MSCGGCLKIPLGAEMMFPDGAVYKRLRVIRNIQKGEYVFINLQEGTVTPYEGQVAIPNSKSIADGKIKEEVWVMVQAPAYVPGKQGKKIIQG